MKKKQLINEIMGVPKAIDAWVKYISSITVVLVDDIIEKDDWETKEIEYKGEMVPIHKSSIELVGKDFTKQVVDAYFDGDFKGFLKSKEFEDFPLYNPKVTVNLLILPDVVYEDQRGDGDRMEAQQNYEGDIRNVKIGNLGKTKIYGNNNFTFMVIIPASYISNRTEKHQNRLFNSLVPTVGHELTHAYQTYRQMLGGQEGVGFGQETVLNMLPQNLKFDETPSWNNFLHLVYLSLSFEVNARVTELYYDMQRQGVKTNDDALKILMASDPWDDYKQLKDFNADKFIREFEADIPEKDPMHDFLSLLTGEKSSNQPTNNDEMMVDLIRRWDDLIQTAQEHIKTLGINIPFMKEVPQDAKKNPIKFFKFFEKRFHKKAEGLKRKLSKVISLAIDESGEKEKI